jgi:D-glycero-D-manno-heptose 1,7-bisphosphate phosphatase
MTLLRRDLGVVKVAFLDRDGVINVDHGYVYNAERFEFLPNSLEALRLLTAHGFIVIIVTNQSGIGRGYYSEGDYQLLTQWYVQTLEDQGVIVSDVFHCPHAPEDNCDCRKPKGGLFLQALDKYSVDISNSLMVGDKISDITAAQSVGIESCYLVGDVDLHSVKKSVVPTYHELLQCVQAHCHKLSTKK